MPENLAFMDENGGTKRQEVPAFKVLFPSNFLITDFLYPFLCFLEVRKPGFHRLGQGL
jgi:hypothetical protein